MKWRITSFTELQHLPPADRERLVRQCVGFRGAVGMVTTSLIVGGVFGVSVSGLFLDMTGVKGMWAGALVASMILGGTVLAYQVQLIRIRGQLLIFLEEVERCERLPMCLYCGYSLEGLTKGVCPECGRPFEMPPTGDPRERGAGP